MRSRGPLRKFGRRFRVVALGAALAALAFALTSCGDDPARAAGVATGRVVLVAVDQSCDASQQLSVSAAAAVPLSVHAAAEGEGTFLGGTVTTRAYQTVAFSTKKDFVTDKANDRGRTRDLGLQAEDYLKEPEVQALWAGHQGQGCGSDLINVLKAVERSVSAQPRFAGRLLDIVYITNGIVINDLANFRRADLGPANVTRLLQKVRTQGFVPDLKGARVHFIGLGLDPQIDSERARQIEQFWLRFAQEAGGKPSIVPAGSQLDLSDQTSP